MISRPRQAWVLGRTFFGRLFESDLMPPGLPQVQLVIWSIAALAMPGLVVPLMFTPKYARLFFYPGLLQPAILADRLTMVGLCMAAIGVVALVTWDGVFPDRRDARILSPLPIPVWTLVVGRLGALGWMFALFLAGTAVIPPVMFASIVTKVLPVPGLFRGVGAQLAAMLLACTFTFFSLIAVQCAMLAVFGRAVVQRLTLALQVAFTVALLQMVLVVDRVTTRILESQGAADWTWAVPSVWFLGVYERLSGTGHPGSESLAAIGYGATLGSVIATIALYAASYARLTRQALESAPGARRRISVAPAQSARRVPFAIPRRPRGSPVAHGVFAFTLRTLVRSRQHRMLLSIYFAIALAIVLGPIMSVVFSATVSNRPGIAVASAPLVMIFLVLAGMRAVFAIPVEPRANWAVRVAEPVDRVAAVRGARRAMQAGCVIPVVLLTIAGGTPLWGFVIAVRHGVVCLLMGLLLAEALLVGFAKVPFTCTYHPGASRMRTRWPAYAFAFFVYTGLPPVLEFSTLRTPARFASFCILVSLVIGAIAWVRNRGLAERAGLTFEGEDPEAMFDGFRLSEGLAANKP